jgi:hypothetical protein
MALKKRRVVENHPLGTYHFDEKSKAIRIRNELGRVAGSSVGTLPVFVVTGECKGKLGRKSRNLRWTRTVIVILLSEPDQAFCSLSPAILVVVIDGDFEGPHRILLLVSKLMMVV